MEVKGKNVVVLGMGLSGVSAAVLLHQKGAKVIINDCKPREELTSSLEALKPYRNIKIVTGGHPESIVNSHTDLVVKNPGVPMNLKPLIRARKLGVKVVTEIEIAYQFTKAPVIGITGTNGKTTTTALVGEIFKNDERKVFVVGNIGVPLCDIALQASSDSFLVTELSSFQLEGIDKFRPCISALLNISEDHMDRHLNLENYLKAKKQIFKNQTKEDVAVINADDLLVVSLEKEIKAKVIFFSRKRILKRGIYVKDEHIVIGEDSKIIKVCPVGETSLPGKHNLENMLAAAAVSWAAGIRSEAIGRTLRTFKGAAHRLEHAGTFRNITFINDSKGTNTGATIRALESFRQKVILIAGGKDKGADFQDLVPFIKKSVKHLILLGETRDKIARAVQKEDFTDFILVNSIEEAVKESYRLAAEGDTVLLSPACASWDMFSSYEERGNAFKRAAELLGRDTDEKGKGEAS